MRPVLFVAVGFGRCLGRHSIGVFCVFEASSILAVGFGRCLGRHSIGFFFVCLRPVLFVAVGFGCCLGRHSIEFVFCVSGQFYL